MGTGAPLSAIYCDISAIRKRENHSPAARAIASWKSSFQPSAISRQPDKWKRPPFQPFSDSWLRAGDVVVQPNGDLLGHGVNVAARLMARSDPGSVLVSADVRRTI